MMRMLRNPTVLAYLVAVSIFLVGSLTLEGFVSAFSIRALLVLSCFLIVASLGQTLVLLIGGIDLSIPFVIGFANVAIAKLMSDGLGFGPSLMLVLLVCAGVGLFNGALSLLLRVHPLIVTLGSGTALLGVARWWTKGYPTGSAPDFINRFVGIGESIGFLPVPWLVPATLVLAGTVFLVERNTTFGRQVFALGSNPRAAPFVHISSVRIWSACFGVSAILAALTGVLLLGFSGAAFADAGKDYLFTTIAAAVVGGTSLSGGRGGALGTVAGALVLTEINTLLIGYGLDPSVIQVSLGGLIVLVVAVYGRESHIRNSV